MFPKSDPGLFDASHMTPDGMNLSDVCQKPFRCPSDASLMPSPKSVEKRKCLILIFTLRVYPGRLGMVVRASLCVSTCTIHSIMFSCRECAHSKSRHAPDIGLASRVPG